MKKNPSLVANVMSNWVSMSVNIITSFFLTPYIILKLGKEGYGIWVLVLSVVGYYGLLDLGLHSATIRFAAYYIGRKDYISLNKTVNTSLGMFSFLGLVIIALSFLLSPLLPDFFKVNDRQSNEFQSMLLLVGISVGIGFGRRVFDATIMACERFVLLNILSSFFLIIRTIATFAVLWVGLGLIGIGWVELGIEVLNFTSKLITILGIEKRIKLSLVDAQKKMAAVLLRFGGVTFITLLGDMLRFGVGSVIVGRFINLEAVSIYGIAYTLVNLFLRISNACTVVTFPRLSVLAGSDMDSFRLNYLKYSHLTALLITGIAVELVLLSPDFIRLWVGEAFRDAVPITAILAVSLSTDFATSVSINALKALDKQRYYAIQTIIEGGINLILSLILVRYLGLVGVALGTAIPLLIVKIFVQPIYTSGIVGVSLHSYFIKTIIQPIGLGLFIFALFYFTGILGNCESYLNLVIKGIVIGCAFIAVTFFTAISEADRLRLRLWIAEKYASFCRENEI